MKKKFIPQEAVDAFVKYIEDERGREDGPLFVTKTGGRWSRQDAHRFLQALAGEANKKHAPDEHINLDAHVLRHTSLKRTGTSMAVGRRRSPRPQTT